MANSKFKIKKGLNLDPQSSAANSTTGDLEVLASDQRLHYHDGSQDRTLVDQNTAETLTNKTIDADSNTITNIENADIKALAAIDATKIADGSVDNTEFQHLDGATGNIQAQIDENTQAILDNDADILALESSKQDVGDYITDLTGDVTASGPGAVAATIANDAVTNAKLNNMAAWTLKGRNNAASGDPEDIAVADLTEDGSPATGDFAVVMLSTGELRKVQLGNIPGTGGTGGGSYEVFDSTPQDISASGTITFSDEAAEQLQVRRVQGDTASTEITASSTPFGTTPPTNDGVTIRLIGQSDTQPLKIVHNDASDGAVLNGDCLLYKNSMLELQWDATADRWIEVARSR